MTQLRSYVDDKGGQKCRGEKSGLLGGDWIYIGKQEVGTGGRLKVKRMRSRE